MTAVEENATGSGNQACHSGGGREIRWTRTLYPLEPQSYSGVTVLHTRVIFAKINVLFTKTRVSFADLMKRPDVVLLDHTVPFTYGRHRDERDRHIGIRERWMTRVDVANRFNAPLVRCGAARCSDRNAKPMPSIAAWIRSSMSSRINDPFTATDRDFLPFSNFH
jgi:hypothetical protein